MFCLVTDLTDIGAYGIPAVPERPWGCNSMAFAAELHPRGRKGDQGGWR
jgi:hypothetical protein